MKIQHWLKFLTVLFTISSCSHSKKDVDVSDVKINFQFHRFEQDLFAMDKNAIATELPQMRKKYGNFFERFNENMIQIGNSSRADYPVNISNFLNDAAIIAVYKDVQKEYSNTDALQEDFESALKHYKYFFPDKIIPQVATFISGFNYPIAVTDSLMGVGLDMYLGKKYNYYQLMAFPNYQTEFMSKNYVVVDAMRSWLQTEFETMDAHNNLLSEMIFQGKIMYALDYILPQFPDTIKMEYTNKQLQWTQNSETSIWKYFIDKKLLYSTKPSENVKYINAAPFTTGMPKESPSRIGVWVGWKIVEAYMEKNSSITIANLMNEKDAQKILNASHYKPKK